MPIGVDEHDGDQRETKQRPQDPFARALQNLQIVGCGKRRANCHRTPEELAAKVG
jgi:hypothetical protein